jgi:CRISPR/Cas system-associated endonuclease Cas1
MPKDNQILIRVNDPMEKAVEEFAEDRDYNKAEASRKILESRLKGEGYLRRHYGDNDLEPMPDGGQIIEKLEDIENEVSGSDVEQLEKKAEREGYSVAHSPLNETSPYVLVTLVLVFFTTLRVFGFI